MLDDLFGILALNYRGLNFFLFHACLLIFCLNVALARKGENLLSLFVFTYGGSTLAGALIGVKPFIMTNQYAIPAFLIARGFVTFLPPGVFTTPMVKYTMKLGMELCRSMIAVVWFKHAQSVYNILPVSLIIGTIAGTFGVVLGTRSLKPIYQSPTITILFTGLTLYATLLRHDTEKDENFARSFLVFWLLIIQEYFSPMIQRFLRTLIG